MKGKKLYLIVFLLLVGLLSLQPSEKNQAAGLPSLSSVKNTSEGIAISWSKVDYASGYYVYRKTTGAYEKITTIKGNSTVTYVDKNVSAGETYTYAIKAYKGGAISNYGKSAKIKRLIQPSINAKNTSSGVEIEWKKTPGASKYCIYYKQGVKWVKLADTASSSYLDKSVVFGSSRTYMVKAISGDYCSAQDKNVEIKRLSEPSFQLINTVSGVKISWNKVEGAFGYRVYYKKGDKWVSLVNTTGLSFVDKDIQPAEVRFYTVKAVSGIHSSSYFVTGKSIMRLEQPKIKVSNVTSGIKISWNKIAGARKYQIMYKKSDTWVKLAEISESNSMEFIDKSIGKGKSRTYSVRAITEHHESIFSQEKTITRNK